MSLLFFFTSLFFEQPLPQGIRLATIPVDNPYVLQNPADFDVDKDGNYYLVDLLARVVFTWDRAGSYLGTIGRPGEGPGEFDFRGRGGTGFLSVANDRLFVMDGRKGQVLIFLLDGTFLKALALGPNRSRALDFAATTDGHFLLQLRHLKQDGRHLSVEVYDPAGRMLHSLYDMLDKSYDLVFNNKGKQVTVHAFHPTLVTCFDPDNGQILIGNSESPSFAVFDMEGKHRTIEMQLQRKPVTTEDCDELKQVYVSNSHPPSLVFPEFKASYTHICSLGDKLLVYEQSPYHGNIQGIYLDRAGQKTGTFRMSLGVDGRLLRGSNQILAVMLDEDDEFALVEIKPPNANTQRTLVPN